MHSSVTSSTGEALTFPLIALPQAFTHIPDHGVNKARAIRLPHSSHWR